MTDAPIAPPAPAEPPPAPRHATASEAARKGIHVASAAAAATLVWLLPPLLARGMLLAAAALALAIDLARLLRPGAGCAFDRAFGSMVRAPERRRLTGATTLAIGCAAAALLFPRAAAVAGLLYAGVADAAAALAGRALGRHSFARGRTIEGSLACFVVAFLVGWALPQLSPGTALLAALALTAVEALPLPIDDNLTLPLAGAAIVFLLSSAP